MGQGLRIASCAAFIFIFFVCGHLSWLFVQDGNWIASYLSSGVSWTCPLLAWLVYRG
jgi:hypothetical protein